METTMDQSLTIALMVRGWVCEYRYVTYSQLKVFWTKHSYVTYSGEFRVISAEIINYFGLDNGPN